MRSQLVTAIFKQGFAAPEQYHTKGKQGPWTDVYGLAASLYFMLTGTVPEESVGRLVQDNLQPLTERTDIDLSKTQKQAIMKALAVTVENRFHTVEEFYQTLYGKEIVQTEEKIPARGAAADQKLPHHNTGSGRPENWFSRTRIRREIKKIEQEKERKKRKKRLAVLAAVIAFALIIGGGVLTAYLSNANKEKEAAAAAANAEKEAAAANAENAQEAGSEADSAAGNAEKQGDTAQLQEEAEKQETAPATQSPLYVPDVQGMKYQKAKKKILAMGLRCKIKWKTSKKGKVNCVFKVSPAAGKNIEKNSTVTLYVRKEKPKATAAPTPVLTTPAPTAAPTPNPTPAPSKGNSSKSDNSAGNLDKLFD